MSNALTPAELLASIDHIRQAIEQLKTADDALVDGSRPRAADRIDKARDALATLRTTILNPTEAITLGGS